MHGKGASILDIHRVKCWCVKCKVEATIFSSDVLSLKILTRMKIVIIGAGPCGLGAAWRAEEIVRQGGLGSE